MILFINACVREKSRTLILAKRLLDTLDGDIREVRLEETVFPVVNEEFIDLRDSLARGGRFDDPMFDLGRDFSNADTIVIAAPYYDLSFPSMLKQYLEQINVVGLTFAYSENGTPVGLCKAKDLYYVTTAGGPILSDEYGFGYVKALTETFYGIKNAYQIKAEGLDIAGADVDKILDDTSVELIQGKDM